MVAALPRWVFTSTDDGNSWTNLGAHPGGVIYAMAQEQSTLGTKYCVIRDFQNLSNNGIYRRHNTYGWQLIDTWLKVGYFDGYVIGVLVTEAGNIWVGTHKNKIHRSINDGNSFDIVKNDVNWDELKIPITSNLSNNDNSKERRIF